MKKSSSFKNRSGVLCMIFLSLILCSCYRTGIPVQGDGIITTNDTTIVKDYVEDTTYSTGIDLSANLETFDPGDSAIVYEGLRDLSFQKGALLYATPPGALVQDTILDFGYGNLSPAWEVRQWASKLSLKYSQFEVLNNGDRIYTNAAKSLATNPDGSFKLELKGKYEWGDSIRKQGDPWPHLYLSQQLYPQVKIPISNCNTIFFSLDAIREYCYNYMGDSLNPSLHTAHVVIDLTIQNRNKQSSLYGKYYIFSLPTYDYRYDFPKGPNQYDVSGEYSTGALVYGPSGDQIWDGTFKDGKWHKLRKNILPLILDAWPIATKPGSPLNGADMNDFYLAGVTLGWEMPGTFDASMRFKDFSIKYVLKNP